ncbi:MAG TPA: flagellar protein FlaG [Thermotogota bacterium]|nr:flagellar protein FlaG [Thermotogota bacterium]MDD8040841.1 flagellar protein FlaG [Thermotogota bacterium]HNT96069.1 flagellar protein FlaG [Thermotogota bacterium]HOZ12045.1 flagellar protein FlaG [Thermotogota bacterium]HPH10543.1 flagellar protein FlaG [Thermotogota bacterium]
MEIRTDNTRNAAIAQTNLERQARTAETFHVEQSANQQRQQGEQAKQAQKPLEEIVQDLESSLEKMKGVLRSNLQFEVDKKAEMVVVKIVNKDTGEMIRQIPPDDIVKLIQNLNEFIGALMDERA